MRYTVRMFTLHPTLKKDSIVLGEFPLCLLLLIKDAQYPWCVLVPKKENIRETYELSQADQQQLLKESSILSQSLMTAFGGHKLNVAALGNVVPQLHIHHIVRFESDPAWPAPVWGKHPMRAYTSDQLDAVIQKIHGMGLASFTPANN